MIIVCTIWLQKNNLVRVQNIQVTNNVELLIFFFFLHVFNNSNMKYYIIYDIRKLSNIDYDILIKEDFMHEIFIVLKFFMHACNVLSDSMAEFS